MLQIMNLKLKQQSNRNANIKTLININYRTLWYLPDLMVAGWPRSDIPSIKWVQAIGYNVPQWVWRLQLFCMNSPYQVKTICIMQFIGGQLGGSIWQELNYIFILIERRGEQRTHTHVRPDQTACSTPDPSS